MNPTAVNDPAATVHDPIHHVAHSFEREGESLSVHASRAGCATRFAIAAARRCVLARRFSRPDISRSSSPTPRAARDGVFTAGGLPTSLRNAVWVAAFAQRHRDESVMTSPPPALQRIVLPILARFAR